jgi:type IV secretion system protein VirB2
MRIHMTLPTVWAALVIVAWVAVPEVVSAATTGPPMPWDGPLETIRDSLSGTVAHILVTVAIILTGILFALGEGGSAARRIFGVAFGGAIALGAVTLMTSLGWAGAMI